MMTNKQIATTLRDIADELEQIDNDAIRIEDKMQLNRLQVDAIMIIIRYKGIDKFLGSLERLKAEITTFIRI